MSAIALRCIQWGNNEIVDIKASSWSSKNILFNYYVETYYVFQNSWIECSRDKPTTIFKNGDGFDFYIDAGRFFPDSTVAVKVLTIQWRFFFQILF